jgi:5-methylcytosine-specific restriction endonuclease McrA
MKKSLDVLSDYSEQGIIAELKRVAKQLDKNTISKSDLKKYGRVSYQTILRKFPGGFSNALKRAGLEYKEDHRFQKDETLLRELQRVWEAVLQKEGRRPYQTDLRKYSCKFSLSTYKDRFGSWLKACQTLLDWEEGEVEIEAQRTLSVPKKVQKNSRLRNIPLKIRMKILQRDNFKCVYCGRSPATDIQVRLEIDHIHPFSKGGTSDLENLQTVCSECNRGKSNLKIERPNNI